MSDEVYWWRCCDGHETAHSEKTIKDLIPHPRCTKKLSNGNFCWKLLMEKVGKVA